MFYSSEIIKLKKNFVFFVGDYETKKNFDYFVGDYFTMKKILFFSSEIILRKKKLFYSSEIISEKKILIISSEIILQKKTVHCNSSEISSLILSYVVYKGRMSALTHAFRHGRRRVPASLKMNPPLIPGLVSYKIDFEPWRPKKESASSKLPK